MKKHYLVVKKGGGGAVSTHPINLRPIPKPVVAWLKAGKPTSGGEGNIFEGITNIIRTDQAREVGGQMTRTTERRVPLPNETGGPTRGFKGEGLAIMGRRNSPDSRRRISAPALPIPGEFSGDLALYRQFPRYFQFAEGRYNLDPVGWNAYLEGREAPGTDTSTDTAPSNADLSSAAALGVGRTESRGGVGGTSAVRPVRPRLSAGLDPDLLVTPSLLGS